MSRVSSVKPAPSPSDPSLIVFQAEEPCLLCLEYLGVHLEAHKITLTKCLSKYKAQLTKMNFGVINRPSVNATNMEN